MKAEGTCCIDIWILLRPDACVRPFINHRKEKYKMNPLRYMGYLLFVAWMAVLSAGCFGA